MLVGRLETPIVRPAQERHDILVRGSLELGGSLSAKGVPQTSFLGLQSGKALGLPEPFVCQMVVYRLGSIPWGREEGGLANARAVFQDAVNRRPGDRCLKA